MWRRDGDARIVEVWGEGRLPSGRAAVLVLGREVASSERVMMDCGWVAQWPRLLQAETIVMGFKLELLLQLWQPSRSKGLIHHSLHASAVAWHADDARASRVTAHGG